MHCPNCDPNNIKPQWLLNHIIALSDGPRFSIDYVKNLIENQGASILHGSENTDNNLLFVAIFRGNYSFIKYLLTDEYLKKDINTLLTRKAFNKEMSLLYIACLTNKSADIAKLLILSGVTVYAEVIPLIEWNIANHSSQTREKSSDEEINKWKEVLDIADHKIKFIKQMKLGY